MKALLSLATILLVACAGTPPAPETKTIEPAAASAVAAESAADRRFAEETRGYKLVEKNGKNYYCRSERASGSNIKAMNCVSENELRARVENAEEYRRRNKPSVCAPSDPRCGGS